MNSRKIFSDVTDKIEHTSNAFTSNVDIIILNSNLNLFPAALADHHSLVAKDEPYCYPTV